MTSWKRIYAQSTPEEREKITLLMLKRIERHAASVKQHLIRISPFSLPIRAPHIVAISLSGMTVVLITSLAFASTHIESLLLIPIYGISLILIITHQQNRFHLIT
jgi:hypothetical protein